MKIGIHSVSSQSGRAYLADILDKGYQIYGYARESTHGINFTNAINQQNGIYLERPENKNNEKSRLISLGNSAVGHDIYRLVNESDVIIIAHPSHYLTETITQLHKAGISKRRIPIILSPSRTFAVPYLWRILGQGYPFVCFSTSPFSCKSPDIGTSYIKRRKRNWFASLEGEFTRRDIDMLEKLFPQALFNTIPATTSIGNIGAIFHAGTYLLNYEEIKKAEKENREYSFYIEGIALNSKVAKKLEEIDQVRLQIGNYLGLQVFGLKDNPNESKWKSLMETLRNEEKHFTEDIEQLRKIRHDYLREINEAITSTQHWLDYTYGVERIPGESLDKTIAKTPTYQKRSVPQNRYVEEDVPTGLVPLLAIGERLDIDVQPINEIMELYYKYYSKNDNHDWRDLNVFSTEFIYSYLKGDYFKIIEKEIEEGNVLLN